MYVLNDAVNGLTVAPGVQRKILASDGKLMTVEVRFKKGAVGAIHSHPHEQISYIVSGSFACNLDGDKKTLRAGDTYYVRPNLPHGVEALEDSVILDVFTPQREDFLK
ncbi:MAG: cupin domain-containing protein [Deltaproteobacteria bacterium]|nr:cupin domain-containing protein [Deltaproteobacteria bacterium]